MNDTAERLIRLLADGELHSGERLASSLGVTRTAVWKAVADLRERGIGVTSQERRGYRLDHAVELLELRALRDAASRPLPKHTEVILELGSTNEYLYAAPSPAVGSPRLVFAELQTAGRGRRGREWLAPFGSGLTFSIGWTFAEMPADLPALGLALGVCVVRALRALGATGVALKWPNDVVHRHRKLGGLLLQMRSEAGGPAYVVAGLGLNLHMPETARRSVARLPNATPVTDLATASGEDMPDRSTIAAGVATEMLSGFARFAVSGFESFATDWARFDSLRDTPVTVHRPDGRVEGIARGADAEGALRVERAGGVIERVHAGDVTLRRVGSAS